MPVKRKSKKQAPKPVLQPKHYWEHGQLPASVRRFIGIGPILENAAICNLCKDYIRSNNRHDFKFCKCGNVAVDGGSWYSKRSFDSLDFKDVIVFYDDQSDGDK